MSKKILALGKDIENEINYEEEYVKEIIEHSINDDNIPEIENEIKEEEKYVDEFMEHRIDDDNESETKEAQKYNDEIVEHSINDNVPVKIKFTVVGEKRRGPKKSELADPNATFFPDPENPTQYFCKICKFKVKRSEIFREHRNHRLSQHRNSNIWKYFAFDPNDQKFCTCSICGNNIEVNPNNS